MASVIGEQIDKPPGDREFFLSHSKRDQRQSPDGNCLPKRDLQEQITKKVVQLEHETHKLEQLEEHYQVFRTRERYRQNKKRAMVLERKRRLLQQHPDKAIASDDEFSLENRAAIQVQRIPILFSRLY